MSSLQGEFIINQSSMDVGGEESETIAAEPAERGLKGLGTSGYAKPRAVGAEDANPGFRPQMEDAYVVKENFGDPS